MMSRKIHQDQELIAVLAKHSAEQRVVSLILSISRRNALRGLSPDHLRIPMSRADVGNYLGLSVETLSRVLGRMKRKGLIRGDNNKVDIVDFAALKRIKCP